ANYNVSGITYDQNGNILTLQRQGHTNASATLFGIMDKLGYSYDEGNRLLAVTEDPESNPIYGFKDGNTVEDDYLYDDNGNLLSDANKGITSVLYNHLNLPTEVKFNNSDSKKINYYYDASGIKLKK